MRTIISGFLLWVSLVVANSTGAVIVPSKYIVQDVVTGGLSKPTAMDFGEEGVLYVAQEGPGGGSGRIGIVLPGALSAANFAEIPQIFSPGGVVAHDSHVWLTHLGLSNQDQLLKFTDLNANRRIDNESEYRTVFDYLPQGQVGTRSLMRGVDGLMYVGQGANNHLSELEQVGLIRLNASVFRFDPAAQNPAPTVYAFGFHHPAGLTMSSSGELFVTERSSPYGGENDKLFLAVEGGFHGFGQIGLSPHPPIAVFPFRSSPAGVVWFGPSEFTEGHEVLFVALEGIPGGSGDLLPRILRIRLIRTENGISTESSVFATGIEAPWGLLRTTDSHGHPALLVSDRVGNRIKLIRLRDLSDPPDRDINGDGRITGLDLIEWIRDFRGKQVNRGDFDQNGIIDGKDLFLFSKDWEGGL